ncbi:MAG: hypothetical protein HYW51_02785 [Candidatus Doudnabacteria bacterium]|nr:hypothetical protein [Candidatus Doudnabacteria bacterium]
MLAIPVAGPLGVMIFSEELGLGKFEFQRLKKYNRRQIEQSFRNLEKQNLISVSNHAGKTIVEVTKNGHQRLLSYNLDEMVISKPRRWDGKWRVVIFDVPEKFSAARKFFRGKLKELGFTSIQKSVWVYPYPCEDELDFLKEIYEVRSFVRMIIAENIDIQKDLLEKFNLRKV